MARSALFFAVLALWGAPASAQITQPSGLVVPLDSMNMEQQLFTFFASRGESIDYVSDARRRPDTFSPLCNFTASLLLNEAAFQYGVGWYNAVPGATSPPSDSEIYEIIPAGAPIGTTVTGMSIRSDPRYLGGLIGFALLRTPRHFTEARWNTVCNAGPCAATPGPWVLSLSYASTVTENAWYVAFEDGDTSASSWNNDGDYNDDVFLFTGITCEGAGASCPVRGEVGECRRGLTECATGGSLRCVQVTDASAERCDAADNDCDGLTDEGDGLCSAMQVCSRGRCIDPCFEGGCPEGQICTDGHCTDPLCAEVTCADGERCVGGACVTACAGIRCPIGQLCRGGSCLDPCDGVTCGAGRTCEGGICVDSCTCRRCPGSEECDPSGRCVPSGCAGIRCDSGEACQGGACVDACTGAACPEGQTCTRGQCIDVMVTEPDAGVVETDAGPGDAADAGVDRPDAGDGVMDAGPGGEAAPGCGCRAAGSPSVSFGVSLRGVELSWFAALGLLFVRRRR